MPDPLTPEEAEALRLEMAANAALLATYDYEQQLAAVQAENARRAAVLASLEPVRGDIEALAPLIDAVRGKVASLGAINMDLASLTSNHVRSFDTLSGRLVRITADLQPAPEPLPPA